MISFISSILLTLLLCAVAVCAQPRSQVRSVYTDLSDDRCKTVRVDGVTGSSLQKCPGIGGFHLLVADDDARMSVILVAPDGQEYSLDYWSVITTSFSSLGGKAEWRVRRQGGVDSPIGLIVRVNSFDQSDLDAPKRRSYLAVSKIASGSVCVTDRIESGADANLRARRAADLSANRPCLQPQP